MEIISFYIAMQHSTPTKAEISKLRKLPSSLLKAAAGSGNNGSADCKPQVNVSALHNNYFIIVLNPIIICQIKYTLLKVFLNECLLHGIIINHNIDKYLITRKYVRFNRWVNGMKNKYVQAMPEFDEFADEVAQYNLFATESDGNKLKIHSLLCQQRTCRVRYFENLL